MARGAWTFVGVIMILGTAALTYMLMSPFWNAIIIAADQVAAWNAELHGLFAIIWQILPVIIVMGVVLYVIVESQPPDN